MKRVGIACTTIFHYIHFQQIAEELTYKGFLVKFIIYTPRYVKNRYSRLQNFFEEKSVQFCSFEELFDHKVQFDVILAPYFLPGFQLLNSNIKKVRCLYGYAKDCWNYAEWNKGFDLILSYGPYAEKRLSHYTHVVNIGHPRIRNEYKEVLVDIKGDIFEKTKESKPVLLYSPTWANLSSLEAFVENIESFQGDFVTIVKLHHGNVLSDNTSIWRSLKDSKDLYLFDERTDLFDLLYHTDVVLSDYSGAIFDAMLFRKPIILIDTLQKNIMDTGKINLYNMQNIALYRNDSKLNNKLSLDIAVRQILPHAYDTDVIKKLIKDALLEKNIPYEKLLSELYSFEDDQASKRAASSIENLLQTGVYKKNLEEDYYVIDTERILLFIQQNKEEEISIWGAGHLGQIIYFWLRGKGIKINRIYDSDQKKNGKKIHDLIIEFPKLKGKILTTVASHQVEIKEKLIKNGLREDIDFISVFRRVNEHEYNK